METSRLHKTKLVFLIIFSSWILVACSTTFTSKPPKEIVNGYPQTETIPLKVGLIITDELKVAKSELKQVNTFEIILGNSLAKNSEVLINELFIDVVTGNSEKDFNPEDIDIFVTPKIVSAEQSWGASGFADSTLSIFLEWQIQRNDGRLIWIDTVLGEGTMVIGGAFVGLKENGTKRAKLAIDSLFMNSHEAISNSQEIRELVKTSSD